MEISVVLPCYNEEEILGECLKKIKRALPKANIIVVNNNSTDNSKKIALKEGVKVIDESIQGYGAALKKGFNVAKGDHIIMADCDNTYNFEELPMLLKYKDKYDLVIGNRLNKKQKKGSMPFLHKNVGTPLLTNLINLIFKTKIKDSQSGFRLIKKESLEKMNLQSNGMELASEMIIKAKKNNLLIKEVDITYGLRVGTSKLNTFRDGWRHIRLILIYGPAYLFLIPGLFMLTFGFLIMFILTFFSVSIFGVNLKTHPLIIGSLMSITGYNIIMLWIYTKIYETEYLKEEHEFTKFLYKHFNLEKILLASIVLLIVGALPLISIFLNWLSSDFGDINKMNQAIISLTIILIGIQTIFSGFFMSILGMKH